MKVSLYDSTAARVESGCDAASKPVDSLHGAPVSQRSVEPGKGFSDLVELIRVSAWKRSWNSGLTMLFRARHMLHATV